MEIPEGAAAGSAAKGRLFPPLLLGSGLVLWLILGLWAVANAPFFSGTDESIRYVAFAAAKNRWATEEDFRKYSIDHFYYPPLYFLLFAPFYGDEPDFVERYPGGEPFERNYLLKSGLNVHTEEYLSRIPASLDRLYRQAKRFSLLLGLVVFFSLAAAIRILFPGPKVWWLTLLGMSPLLFLPEFFYYHTLCNNDTLVNALSALAVLAFVAAVRSLEKGRRRRFMGLSVATAVATGAAMMTKQSGVVLLPLIAGLAAAPLADAEGGAIRERLRRASALLGIMLAVVVAAGGWWILYQGMKGDWTGYRAHQIAHPWAMQVAPAVSLKWLLRQMAFICRSYFGLFMGILVGISDRVFIGYLALPAMAAVGALVWAAARLTRRTRPFGQGSGQLGILLWCTLAATVLTNLALIIVNNLTIQAYYGRLMFPTLVASHLLFVLFIRQGLTPSGRGLSALALAVFVLTATLFAWTFTRRMILAITQPRESVLTLAFDRNQLDLRVFLPIWQVRVDQPFIIPAGEVTSIRVSLFQLRTLPQVGGRIRGRLRLSPAAGSPVEVRLAPVPLGDTDALPRWTELPLEKPVSLSEDTPAHLFLEADPPWFFPGMAGIYYSCAPAGEFEGVSSATVNGRNANASLCFAVVYRPPGSR